MDEEYQKFLSDLLEGKIEDMNDQPISQDEQYENFLADLMEGRIDESDLLEIDQYKESKLDYLMNIPGYMNQIRQMILDPNGNLYKITQVKNRSKKYTEFGENLRYHVYSYLSKLPTRDVEALLIKLYFPEVKFIGQLFNVSPLIENRNEYIPLIIDFISNPSIPQNKKRKVIQ